MLSNFIKIWKLILLSVLLLSLPFLVEGSSFLMLLAFVPIFLLEDYFFNKNTKYSGLYFYIIFVLWNLITTFWVYNATAGGGIGAITLNALQMYIIFELFRYSRRWLYKKNLTKYNALSYIFFIVTWITWEYNYFSAEISWPWIVLGNSFATSVRSIQWYEYTGALGGSYWILITNFFLFHILKVWADKTRKQRSILVSLYASLFVLPFVVSFVMYTNYKEKLDPQEFVVVQPNIDPYKEKFGNMTRGEQDAKLLNLAEQKVTANTHFVVSPETFTSNIDEDKVRENVTVKRVDEFISKHRNVNFILGATTRKFYPMGEYPQKPTYTASRVGKFWYDTYNASLILDSSDRYDIFHKSKLVVMAEFIPYQKYISAFDKFALELGGTFSSYATQDEITIFTANDGTKVGTAICYESVYGEYYTGYVKKGAQVMTIITNDGWWGKTPGHIQHLRYASLRAIETRRSIARSANTGITALINQRGDVEQRTKWAEDDVIRGELNLNDKLTFYVKNGDYIGRIAQGLFILLLLFFLVNVFIRKKASKA